MANPIQQGLKLDALRGAGGAGITAAMANPIQQGLKQQGFAVVASQRNGRNG